MNIKKQIPQKTRIILLVALSILLCATVVFGATQAYQAAETAQLLDEQRIEKNIAQIASQYQDDQEVEAVVNTLQSPRTALSHQDYIRLYGYLSLLISHHPSDQELEQIHSLIDQGYDALDVVDVFVFWRTTDCNIDSMKQALDQKESIISPHWIENAYNSITENRYGVLDHKAYESYISRGLSPGDIDYANLLCRKGVLTIQQILEERAGGKAWEHIAQQIHQPNQTPQLFGLFQQSDSSATKMMACETVSQQYGIELNKLLQLDDETLPQLIAQYQQAHDQQVEAMVTQLGITYVSEEETQNEAYVQSINQRIINNGISQATIESLRAQGYQDIDLLNASERCKNNEGAMEAVLQQFQAIGDWEEVVQ